MSVLSISSWPPRGAAVSSLSSGFLSYWAHGRHLSGEWGAGRKRVRLGCFIPLVPSLPGCHGCLQPSALWVPLAPPWAPCRQTWGGRGSQMLLARMVHDPYCIAKRHSPLRKYSSSSIHRRLSDWSVPSVFCQSPA